MRLSVLVCTYNRSHAIIPCLDSIAQSLTNAAPIDAEIVVVDNNSTDNTGTILREWAASCAFPVNIQFEPRKGASIARNCGLRAARGNLIVMTDDDCRFDKNYIKDAMRYDDADTEPVLRGGRVELGDPTDFAITVKSDTNPVRWNRRMNWPKNADLFGDFQGCNMVIGCNLTFRRNLIESLGYYDEHFGPGTSLPGADDTDLVFRAWLAGITIEYVPDMIVYHHHGRKTGSDVRKLMRNYLISTGGLYAKYLFKHPNLCRPAYWDLRSAVREMIAGKNHYMPDIPFSYKDRVFYSAVGFMRYCFTSKKKAA